MPDASTPVTLPFDPLHVVEIVRAAGKRAAELQGRVQVELKADDTLVTETDRLTEAYLREELGKLAPGWSFLGEEGGLTGDEDAPCWAVDPIDGTTNYARGIPFWCVSVGAVWRGKAIFGVIACPPLHEISWAWQGGGAYLQTDGGETRRLRVYDPPTLMQEDLVVSNTTVERVMDLSRVPCRMRNLGSLAMHLAMVSRGGMCASVAHFHKTYDIAAGVCLCEEAGALSRYINGQPWQAQIVSPLETTPLLIAGPNTMETLLRDIEMY